MDVMRTRYVYGMEKCSVASSEVSGHFARSNSTSFSLAVSHNYKIINRLVDEKVLELIVNKLIKL